MVRKNSISSASELKGLREVDQREEIPQSPVHPLDAPPCLTSRPSKQHNPMPEEVLPQHCRNPNRASWRMAIFQLR
jgi:hypothetical protein